MAPNQNMPWRRTSRIGRMAMVASAAGASPTQGRTA
jgi:hypothetical protein